MGDLKKTFRVINIQDEIAVNLQIDELTTWIQQKKHKFNGLTDPGKVQKQITSTTDEIKDFVQPDLIETLDPMKKGKFLTHWLDFALLQLQKIRNGETDIHDSLIMAIVSLDSLAQAFGGKEESRTVIKTMKIEKTDSMEHPLNENKAKYNYSTNSEGSETQLQREETESLVARDGRSDIAQRSQKIIYDLKNENAELRETLQKEKDAKEDALTRFSKLAGERMKLGNPNIADLSDPNRPIKLAEEFGELYCNEWTDALEFLQQKSTEGKSTLRGYHSIHVHGRQLEVMEQGSIERLFNALKVCYEMCTEAVDNQRNAILIAMIDKTEVDIEMPTFNGSKTTIDSSRFSNINPENLKLPIMGKNIKTQDAERKLENSIREFQRNMGTETVKFIPKIISQNVLSNIVQLQDAKVKFDHPGANKLATYVEKCAHLCWLMRIQFPPVYLELDFTTNVCGNFYTPYLNSGEKMLFPVWPAMFLHEGNGAILRKGVVEYMRKK